MLCLWACAWTDAGAISLRDLASGTQPTSEAQPLASLKGKADLIAAGSRLAEGSLFNGGKFSLDPQQRYPYYLLTPDEPSDYTVENVAETRLIDILVKDYGLSRSAVDVNGRGMNCYYTLKAAFAQVFSVLIQINLMEINQIAGSAPRGDEKQQASQSLSSYLEPLGQYCGNGGLNKITAMFDDFANAYSTGLSARLDQEKSRLASDRQQAVENQMKVEEQAGAQRAADAARKAEADRQQAQLDALRNQQSAAVKQVAADRKARQQACEQSAEGKRFQAAKVIEVGNGMVKAGQSQLDADDANARLSGVQDLVTRRQAADTILAGKQLIDSGFKDYRAANGMALSPQFVTAGKDPCESL